jgi:hypothetical protein
MLTDPASYDDQDPNPFPEPRPLASRHVLDEVPAGGGLEPATEAPADNAQMYVNVSAVSTNDAELDAMQLCLQACEGLNNQAKARVCTWLTERLGAWRTAVPAPIGYPMLPPAPLPNNPGF